MRDVAGMNDEGRLDRHRLYLRDGFAQRAERIRVRGLVKADMTIAHLQEHESSGFCGKRVADQSHGVRHATTDAPQHAGTRPDHAFQHLAAAQSLSRILKALLSHVTSPWLQMEPLTRRLDRFGLYSQILCTFSAAGFLRQIAYFDDGNRSFMPSFPFTKIWPTGAKGRGRR